jgi:chorismate mutase
MTGKAIEAGADGKTTSNRPRLRAVMGETVVAGDGPEAVAQATRAVLDRLVAEHRIASSAVLSAVFTLTPDVASAFPAAAARAMGWTDVPLLCVAAVPVPGAPARTVSVLLHFESDS